jgi:DNA-binding NarL/FixJ family response regulator
MTDCVLVVDDDPDFRGLAARIIGAVGTVSVDEVGCVGGAQKSAMARRPRAVLVDIGLPDGDGITLARWLVALPWRPHVVLTSSDPDAASPEDVVASGANAFVPKEELPTAPLHQLLALE